MKFSRMLSNAMLKTLAAGFSPRERRTTVAVRVVMIALPIMLIAGLLSAGCVRRKITITTHPSGARVFLNDPEIGRSEVTTDFLWYGDYGVTIRKEGFKTLSTHWEIKPPWYQRVPVDFLAEVLWPGHILDAHSRHFVLEPAEETDPKEVLRRAEETRKRALDTRK